MKTPGHFQKGINLGGWLSQYGSYDTEHFETFIQEKDIQRIAGWGFDHVRLPVDYPVLAAGEAGYRYLDRCMDWCRKEGLGIVLDLHSAPGFSFENGFDNPLLRDPAAGEQFVSLWERIAERYKGEGELLVFELLNEVYAEDPAQLNDLYSRAVEAVHRVSPKRKILVGSNRGNSPETLSGLKVFDEDSIIYGFHFYEPFFFTHQRADWTPAQKFLDAVQPYPGKLEKVETYLKIVPQDAAGEQYYRNVVFNRAYLEERLRAVDDFLSATGKTVYCGELGAITLADSASRCRYYRDVAAVLKERGIGYAIWTYKEMSFGLVRGDGQVADDAVLETILSV